MKLKNTCCLEETLCKPRLCIKKQSHHFANKGLHGQTYSISSSQVWMWELDNSEGWMLNNWCFWTMVLEMALESPFDSKEIKSVNPKGNQPWIFIGRTDDAAEAPILWPPDVKSQLIGKDPDTGKDWRQKEKGVTEDEMVGSHQQLNVYEFEQTAGDNEGQGSLAHYSLCSHNQRQLNNQTTMISSILQLN